MWLGGVVFGLLAAWSPFPLELWRSHGFLVTRLSALIAVVPLVFLLGFIFRGLFASSRVLNAFLSMLIAFLAAYAGTVLKPQAILSDLANTAILWVPFLVGVPVLVHLLDW